jgi:hypothetical protein
MNVFFGIGMVIIRYPKIVLYEKNLLNPDHRNPRS